jgi:tRNA threonylcarbamoyladenosine biosynthesis protein TsaE
MNRVVTHSPGETAALGRSFAAKLRPGDVVSLTGNLGSGKTQFVRGLCEGLGARGNVSSPSFTLIHEYPASFGLVVHVDLYRIRSRSELSELGLEEYFSGRCVTVIEWPEAVKGLLPQGAIEIFFDYGPGECDRVVTIPGRDG